jgi:hypothetical protein
MLIAGRHHLRQAVVDFVRHTPSFRFLGQNEAADQIL